MFNQNKKLKASSTASLRIVGFGVLPVVTCPGAGDCRSFCYAKKGMFMFPSAQAGLRNNTELLMNTEAFVAKAIDALAKEQRKAEKKGLRLAIRWFTSGDAPNQATVDGLAHLAKAFPGVLFYLYTKSLHLDWSLFDAMANTSRVQSMGGVFDHLVVSSMPKAFVVEPEQMDVALKHNTVDGSDDDKVALLAKHNKIETILLKKH